MYSVLFALTCKPMPPVARSGLCGTDSAWAGDFARSAMSSAKSVFVIVCAGYLLLLSIASLKVSFEIELFICIIMNLALKPKQTKK